MAICKISKETAAQLYEARSLTGYDRKTKKSSIISQIKRDLGILSSKKIKINILNPNSPEYLIVRDKQSGQALYNNLPEPKVSIPPPAPAPTVAATDAPTAPTAVAAPAKKAVTKPTAPAKKVSVAKPVPAAKKAAAVKPTAKKLGSVSKTDMFCIEVRPSVDGKKVRLGYASTEAEKIKMIAQYKASK